MPEVVIPIRLGRGGNDRKHWRAADRQKKGEKAWTAWMLFTQEKPSMPCIVTITRIAPSNGVDDDNLAGSCKYVRDEIARWLGVDDKKSDVVRYQYRQERGPWSVRITLEAMT